MAAGKRKKNTHKSPAVSGGDQTQDRTGKKKRLTGYTGASGSGGPTGSRRTEVLFGFHSVYEALKAGRRRFEAVLLSDKRSDPRLEKVMALAKEKRLPIQTLSPEALDKLAQGGTHQGIAARVSAFPMKKAGDVWSDIKERSGPFFMLVVESIEDTHNLGALIRTALCANVDYIMIPKDRSVLPSPGVSRSSAGAMEHADIYMVTNVAALLRDIKETGAWVSGLDAGGKKGLFEADLTGDLVLVIGGEHKGIRQGVRKECDFLLSIPISGKVNSLNASVAGGIAMYEARRQRDL